jgi:hypothetical protein
MLQYPKLIHSGPKPTNLYLEHKQLPRDLVLQQQLHLEHKEHLPLEQTRPHQEGFSEQSLKLPLAKQHLHQDLHLVKILQHQVLLAVSLGKINLLVPQRHKLPVGYLAPQHRHSELLPLRLLPLGVPRLHLANQQPRTNQLICLDNRINQRHLQHRLARQHRQHRHLHSILGLANLLVHLEVQHHLDNKQSQLLEVLEQRRRLRLLLLEQLRQQGDLVLLMYSNSQLEGCLGLKNQGPLTSALLLNLPVEPCLLAEPVVDLVQQQAVDYLAMHRNQEAYLELLKVQQERLVLLEDLEQHQPEDLVRH